MEGGDNIPGRVDSSDPVEIGEAIYNQRCSGCHTIDGSSLVGPSLQGLYGSEVPLEDGSTVIADDEYVRESIADPSARNHEGYPNAMQSFRNLSEQHIEGLIAFISSPE